MSQVERTLLDKARSDYSIYTKLIKLLSGDEIELDGLAYHLQQLLEKTLKHQLEVRGIKYPFSYDIDVLLGTSEELTESLPVEIRLNIATINKWESKTRNAKNYIASFKDIEKVAPFILKYYEDAVEVEAERVEAEAERVEDEDTTSEFSENNEVER